METYPHMAWHCSFLSRVGAHWPRRDSPPLPPFRGSQNISLSVQLQAIAVSFNMAPSSASSDCTEYDYSDRDYESAPGRARDDRFLHDTILEAFSDISMTGSFAASGSLFPVGLVDTGFSVKGVGNIELPLGKQAAAQLIKLSRLAPYGHGEETKVNIEVRKTWEIDAAEVRFSNA
jgi:hypothetical protein